MSLLTRFARTATLECVNEADRRAGDALYVDDDFSTAAHVDVRLSEPGADVYPTAHSLLTLARARAFARLQAALAFPVTILSAPAGFGKSTVLRECSARMGDAQRCLTLTPKHGDLLGFMRALATCLADLAPPLLTSLHGIYDGVSRADDAADRIAQWAAGHLRDVDACIAIDGLENANDERIFRLLGDLVDRTSDTRLRWIIVTQRAAALPIARWLADDRMDAPIDEVDLALTFDDIAAAVAVLAAPISLDRLRALCVIAADWPAAIALLLSDAAAVRATPGPASHPHEYAYFAERAFTARSAREQRFLIETCLYRCLDLPLLAVAGWDDVEALLARLRDAGAFVFTQPAGRYQYHESFRAFVEARLRASGPEMYARVALQTAQVCRARGCWVEALELYTDLGALMPLACLLSEQGFALMDRGEPETVFRGLGLLGDLEYAAYPVALALKASLESLHGSFDVAEAWFRHAIENAGDSAGRGTIVFRFATDLVRRDRADAIDLLRPEIEAGRHDLELMVSLGGLLATAYATHNLRMEAARTIEHALEQMAGVASTSVRAKLLFQAGYVALFAREPARAKHFAEQALATALASHLYDIAARALSILYNIAMDYDEDIAAARRYLEQLAACSMNAGSRHLLMYATLGRYEIEVLSGNLIESSRLDAALKSLEIDYSVIATETLLPAQALRATWTGDFHRAYLLVAPTAEKQITPARQAQRYAEIAVYAAAAGLRQEASTAAALALATAPKSSPADKTVAFTKAYVALALTLLGRRARALKMLLKLRRSRGVSPRLEQLVRAIVTLNIRWTRGTYATDLRPVLAELDARDFGGIARLIEALPLPQTFRGQFDGLTPAEQDILVHLSAGLSSSDIATLTHTTVEAVERHTKSLCRKLGCSSPRHAVAFAQSTGALVGITRAGSDRQSAIR